MAAFAQDAGERTRDAQKGIAGNNILMFHHGGSWQSHQSYDPDRVDEMQTLRHEMKFDMEEILIGRLDVIERSCMEISNGMAEGFAKAFYQLLSDTCEEHGNVIDGGVSLGEQMLQAMETVEYSVGRDGAVVLPEFRVSPSIAKLLSTDPSLSSPELQARADAIKKLKSAQALEKEAARKARFRTEVE